MDLSKITSVSELRQIITECEKKNFRIKPLWKFKKFIK